MVTQARSNELLNGFCWQPFRLAGCRNAMNTNRCYAADDALSLVPGRSAPPKIEP